MVAIGSRNTLRVVRQAPPGAYLDAGELGEILLPRRYVAHSLPPGALLDVFLYRDSEDRLVATTETPRAAVGEFAFLQVVSANPRLGAFLDWGLSKDLLLPRREQTAPVQAGEWVVVAVALDPQSGRIVASMRLNRHLHRTPPTYTEGQRVGLLISGYTPLGCQAIVENAHAGLLYASELATPPQLGERLDGYVRRVREAGKIDLGLDPEGYRRVIPLAQQIMTALAAAGGRIVCDDESSPDEIRRAFGTSKKAFKQALGALYRDRRIRFTRPGVELVEKPR